MKKVAILPFAYLTSAFLTSSYAQLVYSYEDNSRGGQLFLTNIQQNTGGTSKFTQKSVTYYPDTKLHTNGQIPSTYNPATASTPSRSANKNAFDHLIRSAAARYGIDPALVKAVMHTESAFNPNARSPVGAMGLMQLMPGTARDMGVNNAYDPIQNIEGGVKYLAWLKARTNNLDHIIAAYNAGFGNVKKYGGIPPFRETQNYVKSVKSRYFTLYQKEMAQLGTYLAQAPTTTSPAPTATPVSYATSSYATPSYGTPQNPAQPAVQTGSGRIYIASGTSTHR